MSNISNIQLGQTKYPLKDTFSRMYIEESVINVGFIMENENLTFTQAILKAISEAPMHSSIYIPFGTYSLTSQVVISKPLTLIGEYNGLDLDTPGSYITLINSDVTNPFIISSPGVSIKNISIKCTAVNGSIIAIQGSPTLNVFRYIDLENVFLYGNSAINGIYCGTSLIVTTFRNVRCAFCKNGFLIEGQSNTSLLFDNCWAINSYLAGFDLTNCYYSTFVNCQCDSNNSQYYGYHITSCNVVTLLGCGCEKSHRAGLFVELSNNIHANMYIVQANSDNNTSHGYVTLNSCSQVLLDCCQFVDASRMLYSNNSSFILIGCNNGNIVLDLKEMSVNGGHFEYQFPNPGSLTLTNLTNSSLTLRFINGMYWLSGIATLNGYVGTIKLPFPINFYASNIALCANGTADCRADLNGDTITVSCGEQNLKVAILISFI